MSVPSPVRLRPLPNWRTAAKICCRQEPIIGTTRRYLSPPPRSPVRRGDDDLELSRPAEQRPAPMACYPVAFPRARPDAATCGPHPDTLPSLYYCWPVAPALRTLPP